MTAHGCIGNPCWLCYPEFDMRKKDKYELGKMNRDHLAMEFWSDQQKLVADLRQKIASLPFEARLEVFKDFCFSCGDTNCIGCSHDLPGEDQ